MLSRTERADHIIGGAVCEIPLQITGIPGVTALKGQIMVTIAQVTSDRQIRRCFPAMAQLRPHLAESEFVARVRRQQRDGYHLAFLSERKVVKAVAGYRFSESLSWGKYMYVDDLVTLAQFRSQGHGQKLIAWLIRQARTHGCDEFHLDSGVQRFGAHRFYLASRMNIIAHHFALKLH